MHTIAIDWGTTRLRAFLLDANGAVLGRINRPEGGMQNVSSGGFGAALQEAIAPWLQAYRDAPVVMAGMVGSRNGWREAPYAKTPASAADLARQMIKVDRADRGVASIIPGVIHEQNGRFDVMRGEETLIFGCKTTDATIVLPGTHSKWAQVQGGKITRFATYMTGEMFALLKGQSILGRLALQPEDHRGFARGLAAARADGGLSHVLFSARADVLAGAMTGEAVGPYLSGVLIGAEIVGARAVFGQGAVVVVADGVLQELYDEALKAFEIAAVFISPETALIQGLATLGAQK